MSEGKRQFERLALYEKDVPLVKVDGIGRPFEAQLYDISPHGAGLFVGEKAWNSREIPSPGARISLTIRLNKDEKFLVNAVICHVEPLKKVSKKGFKLGLRFIPAAERESDVDLDTMAHLKPLFRPMAFSADPLLFDEFLHFQVEAFSATEVLLRTSKSNRSLIPGQTLPIHFLLPNNPNCECPVRFVRVATFVDGEGSYTLLGRWIKPTEAFLESLAEFLLIARPGLTIAEMKRLGWPVTLMNRAIRFRYVTQEREMQAVLGLRLLASQHEGRHIGRTDPNVTLDRYDAYARQVMCIVGSITVATARLVFNDRKRNRSEHENLGLELPSFLWKEGFLEATQFYTHPDYRGADVFLFLLKHISRIAMSANYRYVLLHCTDAMIPIYQRIGAKNLKMRFHLPAAAGEQFNLMLLDCYAGAAGVGANPLTYNLSFKKMADFTTQQGLMRLAPHHDLYRRTIGMMEPLAIHLEKRKRKAKVKREKKKTG